MNGGLLPGIVFFIFLGVAGWGLVSLTRNHRLDLPFQLRLFLIAYCVRFALSLVIYQTGLVDVLGDEDASGWYNGVVLEQRWEAEKVGVFDLPAVWTEAYNGEHRGYFYFLGTVFFLTGTADRLVAAACNCLFGALAVVFTYRVGQTLFSRWVATRAAWFTCFMPSLVIWSAQTVKEPVVIFLEIVTLYACLRLKSKAFNMRYVVTIVVSIVLLIPFRFYAAYLAAAAATLSLALPHLRRRRMSLMSGALVAALLIAVLGPSKVLLQNEAEVQKFDLKYVQGFRQAVSSGTGSGVASNYDVSTLPGLTMAIAVGSTYLLLAPFPWQLGSGSLRLLLTTPELLVWWYLFFTAVIPGAYDAVRRRFSDIQPFAIYLVGLILLYSILFGNVGLAYRQRAQLLPWLLILAAAGQERKLQLKFVRQQSAAQPRPAMVRPA